MRKLSQSRWVAPLISPWVEPYARYQNADVLHALRLGCAVVTALVINRVSQLPHGEWSSITVFIILGLLQYQGAIYTKAKERILGTLLGIIVGLFLLWLSHNLLSTLWVYYLIVGIISAIIGYYAIRQLGYIGMLTGITMCMIISSTSSMGQDGLYRALNVLIGTLTAVAATFVMPLRSTLMWRFLLANNLEACADVYDSVGTFIKTSKASQQKRSPVSPNEEADATALENIAPSVQVATITKQEHHTTKDGKPNPNVRLDLGATTAMSLGDVSDMALDTLLDDKMVRQLKSMNQRLLKVRTHIAATANETGINKQTLDQIQRTHRNIIGTIDLLLSAAPKLSTFAIDEDNLILIEHYHRELLQAMRHMAAVLRSPSDEVFRPITRIEVSRYPTIHQLGFEWQGYFWLTQTLQSQLQSLSDLLKENKAQWFHASGLRYQRREQRRIHKRGSESDLNI